MPQLNPTRPLKIIDILEKIDSKIGELEELEFKQSKQEDEVTYTKADATRGLEILREIKTWIYEKHKKGVSL